MIREKEGVIDAVAIVATTENKSILQATGMLLEEFKNASASDICLAVKADTEDMAEKILKEAKEWLEKGLPGTGKKKEMTAQPRSLESALKALPEANLVLISLAGKYAAAEARKALESNRHVMLFSDNVSIEDEKQLKEYAVANNLLMMGPDCGTAIVNGVALAFANSVRRGKIGIVSAAGTGLQEVSSGIHNLGGGISQGFGTGGRDGKKEIGGLMLCFCLEYLIEDPETEVIVLISKIPSQEVIEKLLVFIQKTEKPVVVNFLNDFTLPRIENLYESDTLSETAKKACQLANSGSSLSDYSAAEENDKEKKFPDRFLSSKAKGNRKYLRGLYSGGTLCYESQNIFYKKAGKHAYSNTPLNDNAKLPDIWKSLENTIIDLGSDEFTVGRPHPMIDYSLRLKKLEEEGSDPETAVILLDVVLGYGSHPEPQKELAPLFRKITVESEIVIVCSLIGTDSDPQNRRMVRRELEESGAVVFTTNTEAAEYAAGLIGKLGR
jgi:FdrA protein